MSECFARPVSRREIEPLLARRRHVEAQHIRRVEACGRQDFHVRRDRVIAAALRTGLQLTGLYQRGLANARRPLVRHLRLEFAGLPAALDGFRILHLSDFHIDGVDGLTENLAEQLALLPVDLCVLTGDYRFHVTGSCSGVYPRMRHILSAIRARHGILGILGNHDCAEIAVELEKFEVRMLMNEAVQIGDPHQRLWVIGTDDSYHYGCDDLPRAIAPVPHSEFKLLLAHSPELFHQAAGAGCDLYLTGHTHAGQIRLPLMGPLITNAKCPRAYTSGHWIHQGMQGYTSAGVGCSLLPIRFGCPPEIVVLELGKQDLSTRP